MLYDIIYDVYETLIPRFVNVIMDGNRTFVEIGVDGFAGGRQPAVWPRLSIFPPRRSDVPRSVRCRQLR